jgi:hypothetical protein
MKRGTFMLSGAAAAIASKLPAPAPAVKLIPAANAHLPFNIKRSIIGKLAPR